MAMGCAPLRASIRIAAQRITRIWCEQALAMPRQPWAQLSDHAPLAAEIQLEELP